MKKELVKDEVVEGGILTYDRHRKAFVGEATIKFNGTNFTRRHHKV